MKVRFFGWEFVIRRVPRRKAGAQQRVGADTSLGRKQVATKGRSAL